MSSDIGSDQNDEFALLERYLTQTDDLYSEPIVNMGEKYSGTQNAAFAPDNRVLIFNLFAMLKGHRYRLMDNTEPPQILQPLKQHTANQL